VTLHSHDATDPIEIQKQGQPDTSIQSQEKESKTHEQLHREKITKLKLEEQGFVDSLKSLARYYHRKKDWTLNELLDLQERVLKLKREMKNFYSINSQIHWNKNGLKYLLELEDDIEETICNNEEDEPFELVMSKYMRRLFRKIEDL